MPNTLNIGRKAGLYSQIHLFGYRIIVYFGYTNVFPAQNHCSYDNTKSISYLNMYFNEGFFLAIVKKIINK